MGPEARAEDALQQALLHAWIALGAGVEVEELRPWLFRIVHNSAVSSMRRRQHDCVELNEAIDAAAPIDEAESRVAWSDAMAGLAALPDLQRRAIVLTAFDGQSHVQVADTLGLSDGAVRGLVYRARAALRAAAAVIVPAPLASWAASRSPRRMPLASSIPELLAGGGSAGVGGLLVKGGVAAVTAGALAAASQVVVPSLGLKHSHPVVISLARPSSVRASTMQGSGSSAAAGRAQLVADVSSASSARGGLTAGAGAGAGTGGSPQHLSQSALGGGGQSRSGGGRRGDSRGGDFGSGGRGSRSGDHSGGDGSSSRHGDGGGDHSGSVVSAPIGVDGTSGGDGKGGGDGTVAAGISADGTASGVTAPTHAGAAPTGGDGSPKPTGGD
jgi:RNA polymerase sigma factor (sigma-70 family)